MTKLFVLRNMRINQADFVAAVRRNLFRIHASEKRIDQQV